MKIIVVLALCFAFSNAARIVPPEQEAIKYEGQINDLLNELNQIAVDTAQTLERRIEEIILEPIQDVELALDSIEARREENEECVVAEDDAVQLTVNNLHDELNICGAIAARTSAQIMFEIHAAMKQITYDGYDLLRTYRRCRKYTNTILQSTCYTRFSIKAAFYIKNTVVSIKTISDGTNEQLPAVVNDADTCTHSASEKAVQELNTIEDSIDKCIASQ